MLLESETDKYQRMYAAGYGVGPVSQILPYFFGGKDLAGKVVLDAGSGHGVISKHLYDLGGDLSCLDLDCFIHPDIRAYFESGERPVRFIQGSMWEREHFPYRGYDLICCFDVIEHIPPTELDQVFWNFRYALRDKGELYMTISCAPDISGERIGEKLHLSVYSS